MAADSAILDQTGRHAADYLVFGSVRHTSDVCFLQTDRNSTQKPFKRVIFFKGRMIWDMLKRTKVGLWQKITTYLRCQPSNHV